MQIKYFPLSSYGNVAVNEPHLRLGVLGKTITDDGYNNRLYTREISDFFLPSAFPENQFTEWEMFIFHISRSTGELNESHLNLLKDHQLKSAKDYQLIQVHSNGDWDELGETNNYYQNELEYQILGIYCITK